MNFRHLKSTSIANRYDGARVNKIITNSLYGSILPNKAFTFFDPNKKPYTSIVKLR
jgi:hypothetical protein